MSDSCEVPGFVNAVGRIRAVRIAKKHAARLLGVAPVPGAEPGSSNIQVPGLSPRDGPERLVEHQQLLTAAGGPYGD